MEQSRTVAGELRPWLLWPGLKLVLQNLRRQSRECGELIRFQGSDHFGAADHFGSC